MRTRRLREAWLEQSLGRRDPEVMTDIKVVDNERPGDLTFLNVQVEKAERSRVRPCWQWNNKNEEADLNDSETHESARDCSSSEVDSKADSSRARLKWMRVDIVHAFRRLSPQA